MAEGQAHYRIEAKMAELLIRAAMNDHLVVSDLLAAGSTPRLAIRRPPIAQLVTDAHVAEARPQLAELAHGAGIPFLVDPNTPFLQSEVDPDDRWVQLPFGQADALRISDVDRGRLVADVVDFQVDMNATTIIPPYFYGSSPNDPWFALSVNLIRQTAEYLDANDIRLPVLPIMCARLQSFGNELMWSAGLDRFIATVNDLDMGSMALCFSPAGDGKDGYGKVRRLFDTARQAKAGGLRVVAWHQGIYGPGLIAAGLDGYECGMGTGEQTNVARQQSSRKPRKDGSSGGGGGAGIYIETLGRSVPRKVGQILLGEIAMRPKVMCDDEGCCRSVTDTLDKSRHHAVRTRARLLAQLTDQPHDRWRLNHIARDATAAVTIAKQANSVLERERAKERIRTSNLEALAQVAGFLAEGEAGSRSA
jgi:hypothetical protein